MNNKKSIIDLLENEIKETEKKIDRHESSRRSNVDMIRHLNGVLVGLNKALDIVKDKSLYEDYLKGNWDPRD